MKHLHRVFCFVTAVLLCGCETFEERPVKVGEDTRAITLVRTYSAAAKCEADTTVPPGWKVIACAYPGPILCTIKLHPMASDEVLGHEVRHCFDGYWHR